MEYSIPHSIEQFSWNLFDSYLYFRYTPIMFPKKSARDSGEEKRKNKRATLGVRKEIIEEHDNVVHVSDLVSMYGMPSRQYQRI